MFYRTTAQIITISSLICSNASAQLTPITSARNQASSKEAEQLGFNKVMRERFWNEWRKDVTCSANSEWRPLIEACARSNNLGLRSWGLARLVEAGVTDQFPAYGVLLTQSMVESKKGWTNTFLNDGPNFLPGSNWQIRRDSPFWELFKKTVTTESRKGLRPELYAVWCKNSSSEDRDLVIFLAKELSGKVANPPSPGPDPWMDLRFWMVMDWLCVFGDRHDWDSIISDFPNDSPTLMAAKKLFSDIKDYPCFWGQEIAHEQKDWNFPKASKTPSKLEPSNLSKELKKVGQFSFTMQIGPDGKVARCRPNSEIWVSAATTMGIRYFSFWEFVYPKVQRENWPREGRFRGQFVLN